jgi:hypothetical protein
MDTTDDDEDDDIPTFVFSNDETDSPRLRRSSQALITDYYDDLDEDCDFTPRRQSPIRLTSSSFPNPRNHTAIPLGSTQAIHPEMISSMFRRQLPTSSRSGTSGAEDQEETLSRLESIFRRIAHLRQQAPTSALPLPPPPQLGQPPLSQLTPRSGVMRNQGGINNRLYGHIDRAAERSELIRRNAQRLRREDAGPSRLIQLVMGGDEETMDEELDHPLC